ncbi:MAG: DUF1622 domain-containing protein [Pyrinomonadaceae bacterium]
MINNIFALYIFLQEGNSAGVISSPTQAGFEPSMVNVVLWLKLGIEIIGAVIIFIGVVFAVYELAKTIFASNEDGFIRVRLLLARHLALALEFQLAADIISTAIAPTWDQIGKLAAIAIIRTALNYFLSMEMENERKNVNAENDVLKDNQDESKT